MTELSDTTVLILGLGASGLAMARWCAGQGARVRVWDSRAAPPQAGALAADVAGSTFFSGELAAEALDGVAGIYKSPGLSPLDSRLAPLLAAARAARIPVRGELDLFAQALAHLKVSRGYAPKVLAITGTNGKTTTTSLTGQLIERAGRRVAVAGNIGPTMLDTLAAALAAQAVADVEAQVEAAARAQADAAEAAVQAEQAAVADAAAKQAAQVQARLDAELAAADAAKAAEKAAQDAAKAAKLAATAQAKADVAARKIAREAALAAKAASSDSASVPVPGAPVQAHGGASSLDDEVANQAMTDALVDALVARSAVQGGPMPSDAAAGDAPSEGLVDALVDAQSAELDDETILDADALRELAALDGITAPNADPAASTGAPSNDEDLRDLRELGDVPVGSPDLVLDAEPVMTVTGGAAEQSDGEAAALDGAIGIDAGSGALPDDEAPAITLIAPPPPEPVFSRLPQVWVLELSSFQLDDVQDFAPSAAAVLNVTQDHLDWHGDMAAYADAKARIFGPGGVDATTLMVINRDDPAVEAMVPAPVVVKATTRGGRSRTIARRVTRFGLDAPGAPGDFGLVTENGMAWLVRAMERDETIKRKAGEVDEIVIQRLMPADALRIRGRHNASNALAALALASAVGVPLAPMLHGLREYRGEPHRVEPIGMIGHVEFFDDSKGTNVGATVAALTGLGVDRAPGKIVVILGGDGKGQDFTPLADPLRRHVRAAATIGKDAAALEAVLQSAGVPFERHATLADATRWAFSQAAPTDAVLLSPACASLDMFRDYKHRADVFVETFSALAQDSGEVAL